MRIRDGGAAVLRPLRSVHSVAKLEASYRRLTGLPPSAALAGIEQRRYGVMQQHDDQWIDEGLASLCKLALTS
jgi:hypothetical protein